jgi:hypothetical protein
LRERARAPWANCSPVGAFFDYNQAGQQPFWTEESFFIFDDNAGDAGTPGYINTTHNGVANLLLGNYQSLNQGNGKFFGSFRFHQLELYGQDTWKLNRKLTLDYGLRWAYLGPTYTVKPYFESYFDPAAYNPAQAVTIDTRPTDLTVSPNIINGSQNAESSSDGDSFARFLGPQTKRLWAAPMWRIKSEPC